ncbi:putative UDP-rhamnose:rhamnosyltransferase 1 [Aegilops tauschii subsp. strangulata]|uniref:putative UDP-rhamnose:rhamnosyltransferase 1 n=1 Tax=Aegilops tauschii subsp. strangulata TaxID=200361 RepID=UPI001ABBFC8E|nr:putative UDP-rhamnose:rhamnosyltransferase 1 [Aegilops tauschii subsp. strangulata]
MEAAAAGAGGLEVVVFRWLAFGHMIPFLELSKRLAARGHAVAFVSTPWNLARLPPVPAGLSSRLRFVPLPLPAVEGLPEGAEATSDLPPDKVGLLKQAMDGLADPLAAFLAAGRRPDWIIHDFCHHWVLPIAGQLKVASATFLIFQAAFLVFVGPRWANPAHPRTEPEHFPEPPRIHNIYTTCLFVDDVHDVSADGCIGKINLQVELLETTINHDNNVQNTLLILLHDEMSLSIPGRLSNNVANVWIVSFSQNF